jgi:hypothetical protein
MSNTQAARIRRVLTMEGSIPEGYAFLVDAAIYVWNPNAHFQRLLLHDPAFENAVREYLLATNRVFRTLQQASEVVVAEKWLNWEKLQTPPGEAL